MRNVNRVPKRMWRKWNYVERNVFNETYLAFAMQWKDLFPPSLADAVSGVSKKALKIAAWNVAWMAAEAAREERKRATA